MIYTLLLSAIGAFLVILGAPWLGCAIMVVCLVLITEMTLGALRWMGYANPDEKED